MRVVGDDDIARLVVLDAAYRRPHVDAEHVGDADVARIAEHLAAGRDVFAYFKHEETPEGALYAVDLLREVRGPEGS